MYHLRQRATLDREDRMERTVARLNIERYRALLDQEQNEAMRRTLLDLLENEEAKLRALERSAARSQRE